MDDIFEKIAKENHTTKAKVKKEIENALALAVENSKGNLAAEAFWKDTLKENEKPIPEEIIKILAKKVMGL